MPTPAHVAPNEKDKQLRCPQDHQLMEKERVGGIVTDRCNSCGRLWLDDGELQRLLAVETGAVMGVDAGPFGRQTARAALGGRCCPRDGAELLEIKHPQRADVLIEVCPACRGVLLDAGELRQLRGAATGEEATSWLRRVQMLVKW